MATPWFLRSAVASAMHSAPAPLASVTAAPWADAWAAEAPGTAPGGRRFPATGAATEDRCRMDLRRKATRPTSAMRGMASRPPGGTPERVHEPPEASVRQALRGIFQTLGAPAQQKRATQLPATAERFAPFRCSALCGQPSSKTASATANFGKEKASGTAERVPAESRSRAGQVSG
mmetsp:Transcript_110965/g.353531  ORF Transcript_110965/g.353531 Transcript_110965/m.353531 type:complete len:176 (+) Transcript_110965:1293-1820(+)